MRRNTLWPWLNLLALLVTLIVNGLANALPLNNLTTGEISDSFQVYFVPAGYVFSIWGLIYLLLIAYVVYQLLPQGRKTGNVGALFVLSCVANAAWIFLWHYGLFGWTLVAMLTLLASLLGIYLRLGVGRGPASAAERWLVRLPFSVYLGWVSVATIANVTDVLYTYGWGGWGLAAQTWAIILLVAATALAALMAAFRRDLAYGAVVVWAQVGIAIKHGGVMPISAAAWAAAGLTLALVVALWWRAQRTSQHGAQTGLA